MLLQMAWNCIFLEVVLIDEDFSFGYSDWYTAQKSELPMQGGECTDKSIQKYNLLEIKRESF